MDYGKLVRETLQRLQANRIQMAALSEESSKFEQFIAATIPLLPENEQEQLMREFQAERDAREAHSTTLTAAIRSALREKIGVQMTVAEVRDRLEANGFDFSHYRTNPLAAISTTLRRMAERDDCYLTKSSLNGVATYASCEKYDTEPYRKAQKEAERMPMPAPTRPHGRRKAKK
jgi:hypothetical protein